MNGSDDEDDYQEYTIVAVGNKERFLNEYIPWEDSFIRLAIQILCPAGDWKGAREEQIRAVGNIKKIDRGLAHKLKYLGLINKSLKKNAQVEERIRQLFRQTRDYKAIFAQIDVPPVEIAKVILAQEGFNANTLKKIFDVGNKEDLQTFNIANGSLFHEMINKAKELDDTPDLHEAEKFEGLMFEEECGEVLEALGIQYEPEENIQNLTFGDVQQRFGVRVTNANLNQPAATPDFLILQNQVKFTCSVHGVEMNRTWIECKSFIGGACDLLDHKLIKQVTKYRQHYDVGIVIFKYGFSDVFKQKFHQTLPDCALLDYESFKSLIYGGNSGLIPLNPLHQ